MVNKMIGLISKQDAVNAVSEYALTHTDLDADKLNGLVNVIMKLPEPQRWIPVSEKLPDDGRTVLVTDWGETDFGKRHDGRWWNCDGDVLKDVSAWMALPEPYKDGD